MDVSERMAGTEEVRDHFRERGKRTTPQLMAVLEAVRATKSHPTAEELRSLVKDLVPTISLGTVYRNLLLLVEEGYVQRLPTPQGSSRFDGDVSTHQHVICRECGRIADVHLEIDPGALDRISVMTGYSELSQSVEFQGLCAGCQEAPAKLERDR